MSVLWLLACGLANLQSFCCCFRIADGLEVRVGRSSQKHCLVAMSSRVVKEFQYN